MSIPLKLQVTGEVTLSPTSQAKCGGTETPAIKKVKKKAVKPKEKKPTRMKAIEYQNHFRAKQPQQQWVVKTAQGEGREKNEKISPTSSDDDKLRAIREQPDTKVTYFLRKYLHTLLRFLFFIISLVRTR